MSTTSNPLLTRADYLTSSQTDPTAHRRFYAQLVNDRTIAHVVNTIGAKRIKASTDPHFSDIPLKEWDSLAGRLPIAMKLEALGDYLTLCGIVCIAKEAARQYVERTA